MKIRIKHKDIEIEVDDESKESTIRYHSILITEIIKECAKQIIEIETKYNETFGGTDE